MLPCKDLDTPSVQGYVRTNLCLPSNLHEAWPLQVVLMQLLVRVLQRLLLLWLLLLLLRGLCRTHSGLFLQQLDKRRPAHTLAKEMSRLCKMEERELYASDIPEYCTTVAWHLIELYCYWIADYCEQDLVPPQVYN
jgi:hypothetical protein